MSNIKYIVDFDVGFMSAGSRRIINNCKSLAFNKNYKVEIIACSNKQDYYLEGIWVKNVKPGNFFLKKYYNIIRKGYLFVNKIEETPEVNCVIYYGVSTLTLFPIYSYCKKYDIKLIVDVVEWYDYRNLKYGRYGPWALDVHLALTKWIPKCKNAIVISSYLEDFFLKKEMNLIRIPPLIDTEEKHLISHDILQKDTSSLNLIYAGSPGKKDMIGTVINAVEKLNKENFKVKLHILGPDKNELSKLLGKNFSKNIIFYGKIKQEFVYSYLHQADFSVLIRKYERFAHAGFPTKFVESFNAYLPVISNLTSDLNLYLKDGYNGFVLLDCTEKALVEKIKQIIGLKVSNFEAMRQNAKKTAIENFDYRIFSNELENFVESK